MRTAALLLGASVLFAAGSALAQDQDAAAYWKKRAARKQECAVAVVHGYAGRALYLRKLDRASNRASAARAMPMTCNVQAQSGDADCYGVTYLPSQKVNVFDDTDDQYMTVFATVPLNLGDVTAMLEIHKSDARCVQRVAAQAPAVPAPPAAPLPPPQAAIDRNQEEQRRAAAYLNQGYARPAGM
ncbi:hypothetical protein [Burkholderia sp. Ac-20349]|uniref:hypothetical protein n=1 Tax=Burkholderia sp. Ac-20349 TaxID=2703893 RepID=UPI00197BDE20|nr:hypothetical protein [Burkholderia sp. Ac-20349]MBN3839324.1 hypothetical protein [Burkholderia sp. Ac-20349]